MILLSFFLFFTFSTMFCTRVFTYMGCCVDAIVIRIFWCKKEK